jgi:hypothetical protein
MWHANGKPVAGAPSYGRARPPTRRGR